MLCALFLLSGTAQAQQAKKSDPRTARSGLGLRGGRWLSQPYGEIFFNRGLTNRVTLETSVGVGEERLADWHNYVVPLLTTVKLYPVTGPQSRIEPYVLAGIGFAIGIENESTKAIGGGGTSIVTGFAVKAAGGIECRVFHWFTVLGEMQYLNMRFNEDLGSRAIFDGFAPTVGIAYRFVP